MLSVFESAAAITIKCRVGFLKSYGKENANNKTSPALQIKWALYFSGSIFSRQYFSIPFEFNAELNHFINVPTELIKMGYKGMKTIQMLNALCL